MPFRVFEFGSGIHPYGAMAKAKRSLSKGKTHRHFTAVDVEAFQVKRTRRALGLKRLPGNLTLRGEVDGLEEMRKLKPASQNIIFGAYVSAYVARQTLETERHSIAGEQAFVDLSLRALKPRGRLILVDRKGDVEQFGKIAKRAGVGFHAVVIPEKYAKKAASWAIRLRATPKKRAAFFKEMHEGEVSEEMRDLIRKGRVASVDDYLKPTIFLFRKPAEKPTTEPKLELVSSTHVALGIDQLTERERRIVNGMLGL